MNIILNGEKTTIDENISLEELLKEKNIDPNKIVVEHNKNIIPKNYFPSTLLSEDDVLEILSFVGGG